jgi:hypothetical protein
MYGSLFRARYVIKTKKTSQNNSIHKYKRSKESNFGRHWAIHSIKGIIRIKKEYTIRIGWIIDKQSSKCITIRSGKFNKLREWFNVCTWTLDNRRK